MRRAISLQAMLTGILPLYCRVACPLSLIRVVLCPNVFGRDPCLCVASLVCRLSARPQPPSVKKSQSQG